MKIKCSICEEPFRPLEPYYHRCEDCNEQFYQSVYNQRRFLAYPSEPRGTLSEDPTDDDYYFDGVFS